MENTFILALSYRSYQHEKLNAPMPWAEWWMLLYAQDLFFKLEYTLNTNSMCDPKVDTSLWFDNTTQLSQSEGYHKPIFIPVSHQNLNPPSNKYFIGYLCTTPLSICKSNQVLTIFLSLKIHLFTQNIEAFWTLENIITTSQDFKRS